MQIQDAKAALELFADYVQEKNRIEFANGMGVEPDESGLDAIAAKLADVLS